jgi:tRNA-2-methylthio-N6-dimethylallyladenosine synthase
MKYHIITIGCQMNKADSERLAAYLENLGYQPTNNPDEADLIGFVTCGVRQTAEDRIYGLVPQFRTTNPKAKIILTGCLSDRPDVKERLGEKVDVYFNIADLPHLASKLGLQQDFGSINGYLNLDAKYQSNFSAYVPIGNGCNNFCSYCVVPYARGREVYRPHEEILNEVKRLIDKGFKEIILIAQNVNSYLSPSSVIPAQAGIPLLDKDIVDFPALIKMVDDLPGGFWIRFATSHPKDLSDKLIQVIAESNKICQQFHLALQSGDDEILAKMNRKYTAGYFLDLTKKIRQASPNASITTDIIVGFPGETEAQYLNTKKLMEQIDFSMAYISEYSPRPGTVSAKLDDDVSPEDKKRRDQELDNILKQSALKFNQRFIGQIVKVLVDEERQGFCLGKNEQFITVKFPGQDLLGQFVEVEIETVRPFGLFGKIKNRS